MICELIKVVHFTFAYMYLVTTAEGSRNVVMYLFPFSGNKSPIERRLKELWCVSQISMGKGTMHEDMHLLWRGVCDSVNWE